MIDELIKSIIRISIHTPTQEVTSFRASAMFCKMISIHTPTQGVTFDLQQKIQEDNISIHTPTQGVTIYLRADPDTHNDFNPHPHAGSDMAQQSITHYIRKFQSTPPRRE